MLDLSQVGEHIHDAEIEIAEGPEPLREALSNCEAKSRTEKEAE
jgi:hypothetical protein